MKTLVTGGAGFIGSHLVDRLLDDGHHVTVIDNYSTGRPENLDHHSGDPNLNVIEADISDGSQLVDHFERIDWVFHLAALADIVPSIEHPLAYHRANVDGTIEVLEASRQAGVKRFTYAASASCYGDPDVFPTPEHSSPRPQYPYALTKWIGEQQVLHWGQVYGLPVISLRFFNAYGPRSRTSGTYGAVFGVFLAQKLAGEPFTVIGDGEQTRDFTFVSDIVDACVKAAKSEVQDMAINIGSGGTYSVNRLTELLGGAVIHIPERPGEPKSTFADTTLARVRLGWEAKVSFEDGVAAVVDEIDYWRNAPVWTPDSIALASSGWFEHLDRQVNR